MSNYVEYLKDPHLVLKIQHWFGVQSLNSKKTDVSASDGDTDQSGPLNDSKKYSAVPYEVTNKFWYYLFVIGTELGDEIFYGSFIPFWFWNVDGAVGRRVVMVWALIMCIGQGIKDVVCWPRPASPPVFRMQEKWALEYGMPSTHAMVGVSIPFSVFLYTLRRYEYSALMGLIIAVLWCAVISVSRLYLGMHTVLDVIVGLILAVFLMFPIVPFVDAMDEFWLTNKWAPLVLLYVSITIIAFYPKSDIWTPTRQDTTMVISVCVGVHLGAWTNYQLGNMTKALTDPPYRVHWPNYEALGLILLRAAIGFSCILATKAICKSASFATLCFLLREDPAKLRQSSHVGPSSTKNTVELCYKYITYASIGFITLYLLPSVFSLLGIERVTFYTEI